MPKTGLFKSFAIQCMDLKALSQEVFITVATHLLGFFSCMDPLILSWIKLEFQYTCKFGEEKDTCKQPESSGYCSSLSCPEYVGLLVHIQTRVNYDRFCSLKSSKSTTKNTISKSNSVGRDEFFFCQSYC
jgi:hypothetical protein